jgi:hypothetical protein
MLYNKHQYVLTPHGPAAGRAADLEVFQIPHITNNSTFFTDITYQVRTHDRKLGNLIGGARILLPVQNWSVV